MSDQISGVVFPLTISIIWGKDGAPTAPCHGLCCPRTWHWITESPAHEVKEILGHVSLAISSRCTHARLAPDTPPLLILQKPVPSIVADRERLLTFITWFDSIRWPGRERHCPKCGSSQTNAVSDTRPMGFGAVPAGDVSAYAPVGYPADRSFPFSGA